MKSLAPYVVSDTTIKVVLNTLFLKQILMWAV